MPRTFWPEFIAQLSHRFWKEPFSEVLQTKTDHSRDHCQPGFVGITSEIIESQSPLPVAVLDVPSVPPLIVVAVSDVPSPTVVVVT